MSQQQLQEFSSWIIANQDKRDSAEFQTVAKAFKALQSVVAQRDELNAPRELEVAGFETGLDVVPSGVARATYGFNRGLGVPPGTPITGRADADLGSIGEGGKTAGQATQAAAAMLPAGRVIVQGTKGALAAPALAPTSTAAEVARTVVRPLTTRSGAALEAAAIAGSGVGGSIAAEQDLSGLGRTGAELGGAVLATGTLSPTVLAYRVAKNAIVDPLRRLLFTSKDKIDLQASEALRNVVRKAGGDPDELAARLASANFKSTPYQSTGDPIALGIEDALSKGNRKFANDLKSRQKRDLKFLEEAVAAARSTGDPNLYAVALESQYRRFTASLDRSISEATERALQAANAIKLSPDGVANLNKRARDIIEGSIQNARNIEKNLWERVNGEERIDATSLFDRVRQLQTDRFIDPESALGSEMNQAVRLLRQQAEDRTKQTGILDELGAPISGVVPGQNPQAKDIVRFRSVMLEKARSARAGSNPDYFRANVYDDAADAALGALDGMTVTGVLDDARAYSRALNDVYRRSVIGKLTGRNAGGGAAVRDTEFAETALRGSPEARRLNAEELIAGAQGPARPGGIKSAAEMRGVLDDLVLDLSDAIDPQTGLVNASRLAAFVSDNGRLLNLLPSAKGKLESAASAKQFLDERLAADPVLRAEYQKRTFGGTLADNFGVVRIENPSRVVASALSGENPSRSFYRMARMARAGGKAAQGGFANSVLDYAFSGPDAATAVARLNAPIRSGSGEKTLLQGLVQTGSLSANQAKSIQRLTTELDTFVSRMSDREVLENPAMFSNSMITEVYTRVLGSDLAGMLSIAPGSNLIAQAAGSRAAQETLLRTPMGRIQKAIIEASSDAELMGALLTKSDSIAAPQYTSKELRQYKDQLAGILVRNLQEAGGRKISSPAIFTPTVPDAAAEE